MDKSEEHEQRKNSIRFAEVIALTTMVLLTLPVNLVISWTAVLPKLEEDTSSFVVTKEDVSWLVSIVSIVGFFASFFTGSLMEVVGPKRLLLYTTFPLAGLWLIVALSPYLSLIYVGRTGLAVTNCFMLTALQPLLAELSPSSKRGFISSSSEIVAALSILTGYTLAHFLPWRIATAVCSVPCAVIFLLMFFVPESPYWLMRKNRRNEAERCLTLLRGPGDHVTNQLANIEATTSSSDTSLKYQVSQICKRENAIPMGLLWLIFLLREFGGKNAVSSYSVYMFRQAEVELNPFVCTILIGAIRLIGHIISAFTMDCLGRKPYLIGSAFICGLSMAVSGLFLCFQLPGKSWVSLALFLLFMISYGLGFGPVPWTYLGELIPTPVRPLGASIMLLTFNSGGFAMNYGFFKIIEQFGIGLTLLFFSIPNFLVMIISLLWVPETKGRSLEELQDAFSKKK